MITTFKLGMLLGLSIIISIGAQNLFLIQQAIRDEYTYVCALVCFICDFILITLGAVGVNALFIEFPVVKTVLLLAGIVFLVWYGTHAIKRGIAGSSVQNLLLTEDTGANSTSLGKIILIGLSFSLLNPAAILDTIVIIGGSANHYVQYEKYLFVAGSITASFIWFFGLAAASKHLSRKVASNWIWRVFDFTSGAIMFGVAINFFVQI